MALDRRLLKQESERKLFHLAWAIYPLLYYFGYPRDGMILLTLAAMIIWSAVEIARKLGHNWVSDGLMREHERKGMLIGAFFQIASFFLAVLLFDKTTAILAMLFCCVGDSVTGLAGAILSGTLGAGKTLIRDYGRIRLPLRPASIRADLRYALRHSKSPALMAVMFFSCVVTGFFMYPAVTPALLAAGAIGAVVADGFAWRIFGRTVNDDLSITIAAGGAISLLALL
jgi:dolichol kinase